MGKLWLIGVLLCLGALQEEGKNYSLIRTQWVGKDNTDIRFEGNKIISGNYGFMDTFTIIKDTIFIHHNYEGHEIYINDSMGKAIEMKDYKLSDSKFLLHLDSFTLVLTPLNESAKIIAHKFNIGNIIYNPKEKYAPNEIITLNSQAYYYEKIKFDTIYFSYKLQSWFTTTYYDLKLFGDGQFIAAKKVSTNSSYKGKDGENYDYRNKGKINSHQLKEIKNLVNKSGIHSYDSENIFPGFATHTPDIKMIVICGKRRTEFEYSEIAFSVLLKPLVLKLESLIDFKAGIKLNDTPCFPTTYRKDLVKHCK